jgi:hypothetical protein
LVLAVDDAPSGRLTHLRRYLVAVVFLGIRRLRFRSADAGEGGDRFHSLATRADGETRLACLRDALEALDGAVAVYREGNAAGDIGTAERLRATILAERAKAWVP